MKTNHLNAYNNELIARNASLIILVLSISGFAIWSLLLGQDANWDFKNYHYYNPFALLSGRMAYDIAPAQQQTFLNPAVDILPFLLIKYFTPRVFGIMIGAWHGINLWLLFLMGRELLVRINFPKASVWAAICALVGVKAASSVSEVGTTYHDLTLSVFILGSVYLYLRAWPDFKQGTATVSLRSMTFSGFLLGLAVGLKLTFALYAIGMGLAILVVQIAILKRYRGLLPFGLAALLAFLLTAGPWMWFLWKHYGNPMFPLYNGIFQSPFYPLFNTFDSRFLPKTAWDAIIFPFNFTLAAHAGNELSFRDFRIAFLYVGTFLASAYVLTTLLLARRCGSNLAANVKLDFSVVWLLVFIWTTYLAWLKMFAVYRYLICIELLSPIILVLLVGSLIKFQFSRPLLLVCFLFLVFNTRAPDWGRAPWADDFFGVHPPPITWEENSVVLIASDSPLAYVIPAFPKAVRFVRIEGNFINLGQKTALTDQVRSVISESVNNLYLLTYRSSINESTQVANQYIKDHTATVGSCEPVISRIDSSIVLCRLYLSGS